MARPKSKTKKILFAVEIIVLLLFIGGLYVYGQLNSKLDKINQPVLDDSKIKVNQEVQDSIDSQESTLTGYTTYALFGIDHRDKNTALGGENSDTIIIASTDKQNFITSIFLVVTSRELANSYKLLIPSIYVFDPDPLYSICIPFLRVTLTNISNTVSPSLNSTPSFNNTCAPLNI
mgnify:CR=1 FL=1